MLKNGQQTAVIFNGRTADGRMVRANAAVRRAEPVKYSICCVCVAVCGTDCVCLAEGPGQMLFWDELSGE